MNRGGVKEWVVTYFLVAEPDQCSNLMFSEGFFLNGL